MRLKKKSKKDLISHFKKNGYILDPRFKKAFEKVNPSQFVLKKYLTQFYNDYPVPFYKDYPIPAPSMMSIMIQSLELNYGEDVLLLGSDNGYLSALIIEIGKGHVYLIDSNAKICNIALKNLMKNGYDRHVTILNDDPLADIMKKKKWNKILIRGSIPKIPQYLLKKLTDKGFILAPIGPEIVNKEDYQEYIKVQKKGKKFFEESLGSVIFAPLETRKVDIPHKSKKKPSKQESLEDSFKSNQDLVISLQHVLKGYKKDEDFFNRIATVHRCPMNLSSCGKKKEIKEKFSKKNVFVDIPYRTDYFDFENAIIETLREHNLNPIVAKDSTTSNILLCKICISIQQSYYGIADVSSQNSNVLYELGMMHSQGMNVALLKNKNAKQPSDIQGKEHISYENSSQLKIKLNKWIKDNVKV